MSRCRAVVVAALVAVGTAVASSCSEAPVDNPDTDVLHAGDVAVFVETEPCCVSEAGVGIDGVISIVRGCVGIGSGEGSAVLLFPARTSVRGQGEGLVLTVDGKELRVGDGFAAGSRSSATGTVADFGQLDEQAPASCRGLPVRQIDEVDVRPDIAVAP